MAVRRKRKAVIRRRNGIAAAPFEKGIDAVHRFFHTEVERKDLISSMKGYVKSNKSAKDAKYINACPEYKFSTFTHHCATAAFLTNTNETNDRVEYWKNALDNYILSLVEIGKSIYIEKQAKLKDSDRVVSLSPMERLQKKISNTVMQDLLDLEDSWIEGEKTSLDLYALFKKHGLGASATLPVREVVEGWLSDYEDAYNKVCPDAVEGYSHLKRPELNHRIKVCNEMLSDLDRLKSAAKATRKTRIKAPKTADKQVRNVKYKKEDSEFKLVSVPPIQIIGKTRLFVFNTKYRTLSEYVTTSVSGFEISGSTIKNFDTVNSRKLTLRKPDDILPDVLKKTPKQIDALLKTIKTKTSIPNGRINKDTILLRVMDR